MSIIPNELITRLEEYNPHYAKVIKEIIELHLAKGHDYAMWDPFSNFKVAARFAYGTPGNVIKTLIGIKIARLLNLMNFGDNKSNYESIDDTLTDLANYILIYFSYRLASDDPIPPPCSIEDEQPETDEPLLSKVD